MLIAAREVNPKKLTESRKKKDTPERDDQKLSKWEVKLMYTHGSGVCVVPVNEFIQDNSDPNFWVSGIPLGGTYPEELEVTWPQIYYGELTKDYAIVNTKKMEVNPEGKQYNGAGGVKIRGWFRRLCFALRFDFWRVLLSADLMPKSKFLLWRKIGTRQSPDFSKTITDRILHIAPFLKYDPDPYIVIDNDGQLWWIVDTYVMSRYYPNARRYIDKTSLVENPLYSELTSVDRFNYIRNPVIAIVNAYSGKVNFYLTKDEDEPITLAYKKAFPNLFKSREEIPAGLENHLRYPDYLTRIQAEVYANDHVKDPDVFYSRSDRWHIPQEVYYSERQTIVPYYATLKLPGEDNLEFVNMIPFTPPTQETLMKAWLVARSDSNHYSRLVVYALPAGKSVIGPAEVERLIETDLIERKELSDTLARNIQEQRRTTIRGNLLVIPVEDSLFYVESIYLKPKDKGVSGLATVVVVAGD